MGEWALKHPALTRLFAVVLAILCLVMLLAGLGNAYGAVRQQKKDQAELERLQSRIDEYCQVSADLEGTERYAKVDLRLQEQQESHDAFASRHRSDLAIYTATRSGLLSGAAALQEALAQLSSGKAQYWAGRAMFDEQAAAFEEGYAQFQEGKRQLEEAQKTLDLAASALGGLRSQVEQSKRLGEILESGDEDSRLDFTLAAYDELLSSLDTMTGLYAALEEQGGISPEQMEMLARMLAQQAGEDVDVDALLDGIEWPGISGEDLADLERQVTGATGMTPEQIRQLIQEQRDSIRDSEGEAPISEEQFALLQAMYAQSRGLISQVTQAVEEQLAQYESQVAEAQAQLAEAQAQMAEMEAFMEQAKAAIEQGRAALDYAGWQLQQGEQALIDGQNQLEEKEAELAEQEKQLRREKGELDEEALALGELSAEAQAQKVLEGRETTLRLILMDRPEIRELVDEGEELIEAAQEYAERFSLETDRQAKGRLRASILMLVGALAGLIGIPAAFEKTKSRFWLIAPVLVCLGCALGAEAVCRELGRGDSYSALAVAIFAAIQLFLVLPGVKTGT